MSKSRKLQQSKTWLFFLKEVDLSSKDNVKYLFFKQSLNYQFLGWIMCGLGAIYYSYEYLLRICPSVMVGELTDYFHLSQAGFGFLSAMYYYSYVPMQIPVGILMDRFGPRRLLTLACLICVIGTYLFSNTHIISLAALGRFFVGFGSAFAFVGVLKLATLWLPENMLGMAAGSATALGTIGGMTGNKLIGDMVIHTGWQSAFHYTVIFGLGLTIILWLGLRDHKTHSEPSGTISTFRQSMEDLLIIVKSKQIWINGFYGCLIYLPTTVFAELWGISYFSHARGLTQAESNFVNSLIFLGFTIGAPMMGFISDKIRRRKLPMFIGGLIATILMISILYLPNLNLKMLYILAFCLGIFYSVQSLVFAVGREVSPNEAAGTAIAVTNMIVMTGAMFLQPLIGKILDWSYWDRITTWNMIGANTSVVIPQSADDYYIAMSIIPLGMLVAVFLTFFIKETHAHASKNIIK